MLKFTTAAPLDARELRNAFGCFATGIAIVTALDDAGVPSGITVNSFSSVSLDPPLILWSIDRKSTAFDLYNKVDVFVVNVLDSSGGTIAGRFATKGSHVIENLETVPTGLGPPSFPNVLAMFECETYARYDGGDHVIILGAIRRFGYLPGGEASDGRALLYYRGRFAAVAG